MRGSVGRLVAACAAAAGAHHRPADSWSAADRFRSASLFRQPRAGRAVFLRAGEPSCAVRAENDPCAAHRDVAEADAPSGRHAGRAEPRRGCRALFRRCRHCGGAFYLRYHQHGSGRLPHRLDSCGHRGQKHRSGAGFAAGAAAFRRVYPAGAEADALRAARPSPHRRRCICAGARDAS